MKAPFKWELIECLEGQYTYRVAVEGGWLVNHVIYPNNVEALQLMTTTFVPDPQHQWEITQEVPTPEPFPSIPTLDKWNEPK